MTSYERVVRAIERTGPDRVPIEYAILPGGVRRYGAALRTLQERYPSDVLTFGYAGSEEYGGAAGSRSEDRWGAVWMSVSDEHKGQVVEHPLADWSAFETYRFPDPVNQPEFDRADRAIQRDEGQHYLLADGDTLFQRLYYLRGMEPLLVDLMEDRQELYRLRDGIVDYMLRRIERWVELGVHGIRFRDDWGTQQQLFVHPDLWRRFFKPAYRRLCEAVHAGGAYVHFHSDGMIWAIIPDFIEIGVDVLHPQMTIMGIERLGEVFGGKGCFQTDLDRQYILPHGTPEEVAAHARSAIEAFGRFNGGVIGWVEGASDVPLENLEAALSTFWTYPCRET